MKIFRRILIGLVIILGLLGGAGYYYIQQNTYEPSSEAQVLVKEGKNKEDYLFFEGEKKNHGKSPLLIFYPGALVEPESYSIWAQDLAKNGFSVAIVKMPLDLAVMGGNKADKVKEDFPNSDYVIGGHSLGGVITSRFAEKRISDSSLKGVFFLASYPDKKGSLTNFNGGILSIVGSQDGVLNWSSYQKAKQYLPQQTTPY